MCVGTKSTTLFWYDIDVATVLSVSQELREVGATRAVDVDRVRHPRQLVDVLQPRVQRRKVAPAPEQPRFEIRGVDQGRVG